MEERKVEYIELIYDLIFVYILGRNNELLQFIENGFIQKSVFFAYLMSLLIIIQVWNYSTFYINKYGRNSIKDHIFIFINMFLLYFMANGTKVYWQDYFFEYNIAWLFIMINTSIQYYLEIKNHQNNIIELNYIKDTLICLAIEIMLKVLNILIYRFFLIALNYVPVLFAIISSFIVTKKNKNISFDFNHLSKRAMLFVVFTFGEMIIAISNYFVDGFNLNDIYFALMAFLITCGLFLTYEKLYNKIINRTGNNLVKYYMFIHIFIIFALNNITTSLGFMRIESISLEPKIIFLIASFVIYFICMLLLLKYKREEIIITKRIILFSILSLVIFVMLMLIFEDNMYINIFITVIFIYSNYCLLSLVSKKRFK